MFAALGLLGVMAHFRHGLLLAWHRMNDPGAGLGCGFDKSVSCSNEKSMMHILKAVILCYEYIIMR